MTSMTWRHRAAYLGIVAAFLVSSGVLASRLSFPRALAAGSCQFLSAPHGDAAAFCDTFDTPAGTGNRSGDLNGTVWGVSRVSGNQNTNVPNSWSPTTLNLCGTMISAQPAGDVRICNGHVVEAVTDGGTVTSLAMYPKQPFDIAGRTGTVSFDVSDDTQGIHSAWPEFWYSDQPVPTPFQHEDGFRSVPRNGFGVRFAQTCTAGQGSLCAPNCPNSNTRPVVTVDSADVVSNYVSNDSFGNGNLQVTTDNCIVEASGPTQFNHIELRISTARVDVYGTDAFTPGSALPPLKHLASLPHASLTLTRGLVWLEDVHYNGDKFNGQGTHTFAWDNLGFDGPVLPQDRAFDVLDNHIRNSDGTFDTGWSIQPSSSQKLTTQPVDGKALHAATGALLTFGFWSEQSGFPLNFSINGHAHSVAYPFPDNRPFIPATLGVAIPLSELVTGPNTVTFSTDSRTEMNVYNVDLIAVGGGGLPGGGNVPTPTPTTPPSPSPAPVPLNHTPCTVTINGVQHTGTCSGTFTPGS